MTPEEWDSCDDARRMIAYLRRLFDFEETLRSQSPPESIAYPKGHDRKFLLFGCQCCRFLWDAIPHELNKALVVAVEEFVEEMSEVYELRDALRASSSVEHLGHDSEIIGRGYWAVKNLGRGFYKGTPGLAAHHVLEDVVETVAGVYLPRGAPIPETVLPRVLALATLVRDIFGNPFCPISFSPSWRTEHTSGLASQMYESRNFSAMPLLADALEEAGCDNADMLLHCRGDTPHVRGCWVVDLILGKE